MSPDQAPGASVSLRGRGCQEEVTWLVGAEGLTEAKKVVLLVCEEQEWRQMSVGVE